MNYSEIANENKIYYAELESLTLQISFCIERGLTDRINYLENKKNITRMLININLDKIEDIWDCCDLKSGKVKRKPYTLVTSKKKQNIVKMFTDNPNNSIKHIALLNDLSPYKTSCIITEYLNNYKHHLSA